MNSKKINQLATELTPSLSDLTIIGDPSTGVSKKITLSQMASLFTGTVEEYPSLASFPLVGLADTIYIATNTNILYRWDTSLNAYAELSPNIVTSLVFSDANGFDGTISLVGSVATLTITTALTTGSVPFIGASGALSQDNDNLFWDDTNNRLGIGTKLPTTALDVFGSGIIGRINGTSTNNSFLGFASAGTNKWSIGNVQSDHRFRIYSEANTSELVSVLQTGEFGIGIANPTTKLHIDGGASALIANLDANVSVAKSVSFRSDNSARFNIEVSGTESGSNAGMDFYLRAYTDAGALLSTPLTITRATGAAAFISTISATGATLTSTQTNLVLNTTTNTSFSKLSFQDNGVEKGTLTYANSAFAATSRRNKLEIANTGGINFITQNAPLSPDMVINSSGNVSIGNTNDTYKLEVNGNIAATNGGIYYLQRSSSSAVLPIIRYWNGTGSPMTGGALGDILTIGTQGTNDLVLATDNLRRLTILGSNGNVGIGISSPSNKLDVRNGGDFDVKFRSEAAGGTVGILLETANTFSGTSQAFIKCIGSAGGGQSNLSFGTAANSGDTAATGRMLLESTGDLKLGVGSGVTDTKFLMYSKGTTSSTYSLVIKQSNGTTNLLYIRDDGLFNTGTAGASPYNNSTTGRSVIVESSGVLGYTSSTRESKSNIENINDISFIYNLNPVKYNKRKKDDEGNYLDEVYDNTEYGFIADEVEKISEDFVFYDIKEDGTKKLAGVEYNHLIAVHTKAIQQLEARIKQLEALINK